MPPRSRYVAVVEPSGVSNKDTEAPFGAQPHGATADVLVQMICARFLACSAYSQSARDRQVCVATVAQAVSAACRKRSLIDTRGYSGGAPIGPNSKSMTRSRAHAADCLAVHARTFRRK
jgi:hypothetical protein